MDLGTSCQTHANCIPLSTGAPSRPEPDFAYDPNLNDGAKEPPQRDESLRLANIKRLSETAADSNNNNYFQSPRVESPRSCSPVSEQSMNSNARNLTPPESPKPESPRERTATGLSRLSLDNNDNDTSQYYHRGRSPLDHDVNHSTKRAASNDLDQPPTKVPSGTQGHGVRTTSGLCKQNTPSSRRAGARLPKQGAPGRRSVKRDVRHGGFDTSLERVAPTQAVSKVRFQAVQRDSGYYSQQPSREPTIDQMTAKRTAAAAGGPIHRSLSCIEEQPCDVSKHLTDPAIEQGKDPVMLLQPDSSPISREQLAAEVKGIYAGLVMVEAKCMNICKAQAADPRSQLSAEQWQSLIALHRTLLYEHHDFLMATQHPSANDALKGLASKYSMPARMWRHGIHAFLEVLRHRRPESQDYMLAFVYLAYQMMALLYETVVSYQDTWIECLGDLARYRMAIEDNREIHAIWGGVAGDWYKKASNRHPEIGRLYHHLGILERPSLCKLSLYAKSLTCAVPFANAKDSLATLCGPIVQDETSGSGKQSCEARMVTFHAHQFSKSAGTVVSACCNDALISLREQPAAKIRSIGVNLVITNVAALMELGSESNILFQSFRKTINDTAHSLQSSGTHIPTNNVDSYIQPSIATTSSSATVQHFCYSTFNMLLQHRKDRFSLRESLPSIHTALVWLHGLHHLRTILDDDRVKHTCSSLLNADTFSWGGLCDYLNALAQTEPITARTIEMARQGSDFQTERKKDAEPLPEDHVLRGLIWSRSYHPSDWFDRCAEDEPTDIEKPGMHSLRAQRVHWLGLFFAFRVEHLRFDVSTRMFTASQKELPAFGERTSTQPAQPKTVRNSLEHRAIRVTPPSRSSTTLSGHTDSDGFEVLTSSKLKHTKTRAKAGSKPTKRRPDCSNVKIAGEEYMDVEA